MKKLNLRALAAGLATSVAMTCLSGVPAFAAAQKVGDAAQAVMPTRAQAVEALERANDKWITSNGHGRSFWDNAAYHVGNMEAYFTTGIELYRNYSEAWAIQNNWKGATSNNKNAWKGNASNGGYGEGQDWVLFGDWQICFQTYIDLYNDEVMASKNTIKDEGKVARAIEVMSYQASRSETDWWWWADSLFMAMPIMSKLYVLTGDYKYLDKQYEWFKWAAEDVEGGTKDGMWDAEEQLFHRDGKYIYPDHKTDSGKKDFWARGSGWVFAGLARVLSDMPTDYQHRDYFLDKYTQMAQGVARNQQKEGFWSRSIIDRAYADGFESSGTSFFTYGLAWGINSGYLDRSTYLDTALKGWYFLYNTALQADGTVGYVQPIGENPRQSLNIGGGNTANFGVGAFLLAACEISKLAGGVYGDQTNNNDIYPYIMRKLVGKYVIEVNTAHFYHDGVINHHDESNHNMQTYVKDGTTMLPVIAIKNYMTDCDVTEDGDTVYVTRDIKNGSNTTRKTVVFNMGSANYTVDGAAGVLPTAAERKDGYACVPVRQVMEGLGYKIWYSAYSGTSNYVANNPMDALIVISEKADPFFDCDSNAVEMLRWMLEVNHHYPERVQSPKPYTVEKPMQAATEAYGTQIPLTTSMLSASATPEAANHVGQTIDNNVETRWAAQGKQYMTIDLGVPMQISCVGVRMMRYTDSRVINYGVSISSDNTNWTSVFNGTSVPNGATWEFPKVDGKVARYVRINVNGSSTNDWASVADVAVFQGDANSPKASGVSGSSAGGVVTQGVTNSASGTKVTLNSGMLRASAEPQSENPARAAVDGNPGTVWAAEGSANLVVDLGSTMVVSSVGVQMKQYDDTRTVNYGVEVSENGSNYTSYYSGACAPGGGVMEYIPVAANARYVRINVNGNSVSNWASVAEIEVYTGGTAKPATGQVQQGVGPVVTPGGKITLNAGMVKASAQPQSENPASAIVDGNPNTYWAVEGSANIVIDLGSAQTIGTVGVQMRNYSSEAPNRTLPYTVSVSADGSSYTSVASKTSPAGGGVMESITVGQNARYVKIDVNGSNEGQWASVAEVEVYGGTVSGGSAGGAFVSGLSSTSTKPVGNRINSKSAAALIIADTKFPASAAIDGDKNTAWKGLANQSIVVEAAAEKTITSIGIRGQENDITYSVSVSSDGSAWTAVYSGSAAAGATTYHPCQVKGKYVMVTLLTEGKVAEVEIYGAE